VWYTKYSGAGSGADDEALKGGTPLRFPREGERGNWGGPKKMGEGNMKFSNSNNGGGIQKMNPPPGFEVGYVPLLLVVSGYPYHLIQHHSLTLAWKCFRIPTKWGATCHLMGPGA